MRVAGFLLLTATLCVTACLPIPYRTSEWVAAPADAETLKVGDDVRIKNKNTGKYYLFTVDEFTNDGFIGRHENDKTYRLRYTDLASLEVKRGEWHVFPLPLSGQIKGGGINWGFLVAFSLAALLRGVVPPNQQFQRRRWAPTSAQALKEITMQGTLKHCSMLLLTALVAAGCSIDPWMGHPFVVAHLTPQHAVVTSSGYATIVEVEPPPLAKDSIAKVFQVEPARHTLTVEHAVSEETTHVGVNTREVAIAYSRCQLTFAFQPGKLYHVKKASLNSAGELQLFYGKERGVWLTEHNSDRPLAECK